MAPTKPTPPDRSGVPGISWPRGRRLLGGLIVLIVVCSACATNPPAAATDIEVTTTCRSVTELGTGMLIDNGLVLTSAHVVAAAEDITIRLGGRETAASVVAFDPDNDLAYLQPDIPVDHGWALARRDELDDVPRGAAASVYVSRDGQLQRVEATIVRRVEIDTEDIYIDDDVTRPGWEVRYPIESGDSGAPVVVGGVVIGVVWAKSRAAADRAYAIDPVVGGDLLTAQLTGQLGSGQLGSGQLFDRDGSAIDFDRC